MMMLVSRNTFFIIRASLASIPDEPYHSRSRLVTVRCLQQVSLLLARYASPRGAASASRRRSNFSWIYICVSCVKSVEMRAAYVVLVSPTSSFQAIVLILRSSTHNCPTVNRSMIVSSAEFSSKWSVKSVLKKIFSTRMTANRWPSVWKRGLAGATWLWSRILFCNSILVVPSMMRI